MQKKWKLFYLCISALILAALACNLPGGATPAQPSAAPATETLSNTVTPAPDTATLPAPTVTSEMLSQPTATLPPATATSTQPVAASPVVPPVPSGDVHAVVDVKMDDVLNIRSGPGVNNPVVSFIPPFGMDVRVTGASVNVGNSLWVPVQFQDRSGWVNSSYLARQVGSTNVQVAARAVEAIQALKAKDFKALSAIAHPAKGVRFSPYGYVRSEDLVFSAAQLAGLASDTKSYLWGSFDGSGEPIQMTFNEYYKRFIYDVDFARPQMVGFNLRIGQGNTINNIAEFYPGAIFVEYHFPGFDPQYSGMDWRSLRLVFDQVDGDYFLVGIVHDEWTI